MRNLAAAVANGRNLVLQSLQLNGHGLHRARDSHAPAKLPLCSTCNFSAGLRIAVLDDV
jgi:hypothetical protein